MFQNLQTQPAAANGVSCVLQLSTVAHPIQATLTLQHKCNTSSPPHGAGTALRMPLNKNSHLLSSITQGNQADTKHSTQLPATDLRIPGLHEQPSTLSSKGTSSL